MGHATNEGYISSRGEGVLELACPCAIRLRSQAASGHGRLRRLQCCDSGGVRLDRLVAVQDRGHPILLRLDECGEVVIHLQSGMFDRPTVTHAEPNISPGRAGGA